MMAGTVETFVFKILLSLVAITETLLIVIDIVCYLYGNLIFLQ